MCQLSSNLTYIYTYSNVRFLVEPSLDILHKDSESIEFSRNWGILLIKITYCMINLLHSQNFDS